MTSSGEATRVRPVRLLGTTWANRGPRYWLRRTALTAVAGVVAVLVVAVYVGLATGLLSAAQSPAADVVIVVVFVVGAVWSTWAAVSAYRPIIRAERNGDMEALRAIAERKRGRKTGVGAAGGAGIGLGALAGSALAASLLAFGSIFIVGWPIVMFGMSLRRYYSADECLAVLESGRAG